MSKKITAVNERAFGHVHLEFDDGTDAIVARDVHAEANFKVGDEYPKPSSLGEALETIFKAPEVVPQTAAEKRAEKKQAKADAKAEAAEEERIEQAEEDRGGQ